MWCVWHGIETPSVERLELTDTPDGALARSTVETPGEQYEYDVTLGPDWVVRTLAVTPDPQRYTRLAEDRYVYESRDSDFRREITVDTHGLVVDYPGLYRREG